MFRLLKSFFPKVPVIFLFCLLLSCWLQAQAKQDLLEVNWDSLDLSDQQRSSLNNLDQQWKNTVSQIAPRLHANERLLKHMIYSSTPNEDQILQLQEDIHEDKMRLKMNATEIFLDKRRVLNPQQQEKLQQIINLH
jgi:Spy/CpxP family protein refolding chaperone